MEESLDIAEHDGTQKALKESDFFNREVSKDSGEGSMTSDNDDGFQELTSPGDLLIPMWSEIDTEHPEFMVEVEVISSWADGIEGEDEQIGEEFMLTEESCPSPGSTGEYSDYGSESGNETVAHLDESILSSLPPVKVEYSTENFIPTVPESVERTYVYHDTVQTEPVNLKREFIPEYQEPSIETNTLNCQDIPSQNCNNIPKLELTDDSGSEKSYSNDGDSEGSSSGKSERKRPGRKKGQVSRVYHLWEFIRDLLNDPQCCPSLIRWENEAEGIFRVVRSEDVAKLWGQKKKNRTAMTYEKMSRSIRYSRKEGYFADLPKDKGYPKKLCFKFGDKSSGWNTTMKTS
ncbi:hypothetical protein ACJMK2_020289 [Sinanodonta woodiana]|uniref:ETS domain-containing protein n=1 Tax=Sinanodonta woodiana TaxID=1069815 RepID=A0ABD3TYY9_SINWO